jgi:release factor glutamine methyltransferase
MAADARPDERAAPQTAGEMLARARAFLARSGVEEARLEAELLVGRALARSRLELYLALDLPVSAREREAARALLARRARGEPCAYVLGEREFYGRTFHVGPGVLVPRPETELLVDRARAWVAERGARLPAAPAIADFGTGSGVLAVTLALELSGARVVASDVSERAIETARANAARLGAGIELVLGGGLGPLAAAAPRGGFDVLVANPPYVDSAERGSLPREVREWEPPEALFAPEGDPDHWLREIAGRRAELVRPDGLVLVELGLGQSERAAQWLAARGIEARFHRDLARVARVLEL